MVGHAFPLFAGFRGGKAVMTFVGGALRARPARRRPLPRAVRRASASAAVVQVGRARGRVRVPGVQLATDPVEHVMATGGLMYADRRCCSLIDRPGRATSAPGRSADSVSRTAVAGSASGESQNGAPRRV